MHGRCRKFLLSLWCVWLPFQAPLHFAATRLKMIGGELGACPGLASSPGPSPPRRGLVHTVCACAKYSALFSVKKKLRALPCPYVEDYTNQEYRAFFEIDSSDDLTCRTLLGYYFSDVAVSFFQTYNPTER